MEDSRHDTVIDTDRQQLGEVYARALVGVGQKRGSTESLLEQLAQVLDVLHSLPRLDAVLRSPRIGVDEKKAVLAKAFGGRLDSHLLNFLRVVVDHGRFDCLAAILAAAQQLADEMAGRLRATLTTAEPVDDAIRQRVQDKLSGLLGKQVQLAASVDPQIIGGLVVRVGDTVYDASVLSRLNHVRARASRNVAGAIRESFDKFMAG